LIENTQNRYKYDELAITTDRYIVSCRVAAAIVNAALKDMGILDQSNMLDRNKLQSERERVSQLLIAKNKVENIGFECLGFDGRKDDTLTEGGLMKEEHYVVVKVPGSIYVDHVTPDHGNA
jgi:hypothetical protein